MLGGIVWRFLIRVEEGAENDYGGLLRPRHGIRFGR